MHIYAKFKANIADLKNAFILKDPVGRRKQRVVLNGRVSDWIPVTSGTPEGGHLSPLLFALFVNDLPNVISTNCLMFCDDFNIFHKVTYLHKRRSDSSKMPSCCCAMGG